MSMYTWFVWDTVSIYSILSTCAAHVLKSLLLSLSTAPLFSVAQAGTNSGPSADELAMFGHLCWLIKLNLLYTSYGCPFRCINSYTHGPWPVTVASYSILVSRRARAITCTLLNSPGRGGLVDRSLATYMSLSWRYTAHNAEGNKNRLQMTYAIYQPGVATVMQLRKSLLSGSCHFRIAFSITGWP